MDKIKNIHDENVSLTNEDTFDYVFMANYTPLVLFANSYVNNDQDTSEDLVQDVFFQLLQKNVDFENIVSLKAYLYKSVRNACLNYNKHKKVKQLYADGKKSALQAESNFLNQIIKEEVYFHLVKAVASLPNRCKNVFELTMEGFKNAEIATHMQISVETVKSQKKRGRKILAELMKPVY